MTFLNHKVVSTIPSKRRMTIDPISFEETGVEDSGRVFLDKIDTRYRRMEATLQAMPYDPANEWHEMEWLHTIAPALLDINTLLTEMISDCREHKFWAEARGLGRIQREMAQFGELRPTFIEQTFNSMIPQPEPIHDDAMSSSGSEDDYGAEDAEFDGPPDLELGLPEQPAQAVVNFIGPVLPLGLPIGLAHPPLERQMGGQDVHPMFQAFLAPPPPLEERTLVNRIAAFLPIIDLSEVTFTVTYKQRTVSFSIPVDDIPERFRGQMTGEVMKDPLTVECTTVKDHVVTIDAAYKDYYCSCSKCMAVSPTLLTENVKLKSEIRDWLLKQIEDL
jgi:hypothetical protein